MDKPQDDPARTTPLQNDPDATAAERDPSLVETSLRDASTRQDSLAATHELPAAETFSFHEAATPALRPKAEGRGAAATMPPRLGRFELRARLGAGSFGEVFRAFDEKLQREVALKVARPQRMLSPEDFDDFFREARAAAQCKHPHIVPVYEVGREGQTAYIVAELIEGQSFDRVLKERKFTPREAVALILDLADALHAAHQQGVFHRDIKPANTMLDQQGRIALMDFGLARRSEGEVLRTQQGDILGTPAYMSPEQARGDSHRVDARSDLYSLGVMLYEMLTGQRPFQGTDVLSVLKQVVNDEPLRPRSLNRGLSPDLEAIVLKALAKRPEDRYPTVQHFREDLQRWQAGRPVEARRIGPLGRGLKWARRNPLPTSVAAFFCVALSAGLIYRETRSAYLDLRIQPVVKDLQVRLDEQPVTVDAEGRALVAHGPGQATLRIIAPDHEPIARDLVLARGSENTLVTQLNLVPEFGYLRIHSQPDGAQLRVLDTQGTEVARGATPFHSPRLRKGAYRVDLSKEMFRSRLVSVQVASNDRLVVVPEVRLEADSTQSAGLDFLRKGQEALAKLVTLRVRERVLPEAIETLQAQSGLAITLDLNALRNEGISPQVKVSCEAENQPLSGVFALMLQPMQLTAIPAEDGHGGLQLVVTTPSAARQRTFAVIYPVSDLINANSTPADSEQLLRALTNAVQPATWDVVGGYGNAQVDRPRQTLSVRQTWSVHRDVQDYLKQAKQLQRTVINRPPGPTPGTVVAPQGTVVAPPGQSPERMRALTRLRALKCEIIQTGPYIYTATIRAAEGTEEVLQELRHFPELSTLLMIGVPITNAELGALRALKSLSWLGLQQTQLEAGALAELREIARLTALDLTGTAVPEDEWDALRSLPQLKALTLNQTSLTRPALSKLVSFPHLASLQLESCPLAPADFVLLGSCTKLTTLNLARTPLADAGLVGLPNLANLSFLDLSATKITPDGLLNLARCRSLQSLRLSDLSVSADGLAALARLPKLKYLYLDRCQLDRAGLQALGACPSLELLSLRAGNVDDALVVELQPPAPLRDLDVSLSHVTRTGIFRLQQQRPGLRVRTSN